MSYKKYKHCPYSDELMDKIIYKENYNFKLPPIITIKYHDKIPEDFYTEECKRKTELEEKLNSKNSD